MYAVCGRDVVLKNDREGKTREEVKNDEPSKHNVVSHRSGERDVAQR